MTIDDGVLILAVVAILLVAFVIVRDPGMRDSATERPRRRRSRVETTQVLVEELMETAQSLRVAIAHGASRAYASEKAGWRIEEHREPDAFLVRTELPGVSPEDIDVDVDAAAGELRIRARRDVPTTVEGASALIDGWLTRSILLPDNAGLEGLSAKYDQGILEIRVPLSARAAVPPASRPDDPSASPHMGARGREMRDKILSALERLSRTTGRERLTVRDVVREAGIHEGTFYLYFANLDDAFGYLESGASEQSARSTVSIRGVTDASGRSAGRGD